MRSESLFTSDPSPPHIRVPTHSSMVEGKKSALESEGRAAVHRGSVLLCKAHHQLLRRQATQAALCWRWPCPQFIHCDIYSNLETVKMLGPHFTEEPWQGSLASAYICICVQLKTLFLTLLDSFNQFFGLAGKCAEKFSVCLYCTIPVLCNVFLKLDIS